MKKGANKYVWVIYITAMLILILDSRNAIEYALKGVDLCIQSVIPSLFPFIVLSGLLTGSLSNAQISGIKPLNKLFGIPQGSEILVLLGFLGGYPVGAKNICDAHCGGFLKKETAKRMLIFCNNAGPAFIFGIVASQFPSPSAGWYLWGVLILSALITAALLPNKPEAASTPTKKQENSPQAILNAVKATGSICGWVVIFRVLLGFAERLLLNKLPNEVNVLISGLLELTNGCVRLTSIPGGFERFAVGAVLLSFGGVCVTMQTATVVGTLKMDSYIQGKVLQSCISYILCLALQPVLFPSPIQWQSIIVGIAASVIAAFTVYYFRNIKECSRFPARNIVYCQHRTIM